VSLAVHLILSYLIGAFPTAVVLGRLLWKTDVRRHGSGNAGATNAWRVLGWKAGVPVLVVDLVKGALAAGLIARLRFLGNPSVDLPTLAVLCGLSAVLGHVFPIYTRFRGGKGVATAAGMFVVIAPIPVAIAAGVFALLLIASGCVSLGSLLAAWTIPLSVLFLPRPPTAGPSAALLGLAFASAAFITITHRTNIRRLLRGEEKTFPQLQLWRLFFRRSS
jgi:glycerol-3-phosphate acyltransferase PlsY